MAINHQGETVGQEAYVLPVFGARRARKDLEARIERLEQKMERLETAVIEASVALARAVQPDTKTPYGKR